MMAGKWCAGKLFRKDAETENLIAQWAHVILGVFTAPFSLPNLPNLPCPGCGTVLLRQGVRA